MALLDTQLIASRTPQGVRGLKCTGAGAGADLIESHPARGAWIEIPRNQFFVPFQWSHPARGAWIEIFYAICTKLIFSSRTPQGVRGLKCGGGGSLAPPT